MKKRCFARLSAGSGGLREGWECRGEQWKAHSKLFTCGGGTYPNRAEGKKQLSHPFFLSGPWLHQGLSWTRHAIIPFSLPHLLSLPTSFPSPSLPLPLSLSSLSLSLFSLQPDSKSREGQEEQASELQEVASELSSELSTLRIEYEQLEMNKKRQGENLKRVISELKEELAEVSERQHLLFCCWVLCTDQLLVEWLNLISLNHFHLLQKDKESKKLEDLVASQKQELEQLSSRCVIGMKEENDGRERARVTKRCLCHSPQDCRCTVSTLRVRWFNYCSKRWDFWH